MPRPRRHTSSLLATPSTSSRARASTSRDGGFSQEPAETPFLFSPSELTAPVQPATHHTHMGPELTKELLDYIQATEWKYQPVEAYIGK